MTTMATIVIGLVIAGYTGYLIIRQIKNVKTGNFCACCSGCASAKSCEQLENGKKNKGKQAV